MTFNDFFLRIPTEIFGMLLATILCHYMSVVNFAIVSSPNVVCFVMNLLHKFSLFQWLCKCEPAFITSESGSVVSITT